MNLYDLIQAVEHNEATQSLQLCWNTQKSFFFYFSAKVLWNDKKTQNANVSSFCKMICVRQLIE